MFSIIKINVTINYLSYEYVKYSLMMKCVKIFQIRKFSIY